MSRHHAIHRPLLVASAALGVMLVLVTWPAGLSADLVRAESARHRVAQVTAAPTGVPSIEMRRASDSRRGIEARLAAGAAKRASRAAVDPVALATSYASMGTACSDAGARTAMFTMCDPGEYSATCCDDGTLVETLCKDGPTHGTMCQNSPWEFTPTHCVDEENGDEFDIPTICAGGETIPTECPDQSLPTACQDDVLHTICEDGPSQETACQNAAGGVVPTMCITGPVHTQCPSGLLHTICAGGVPSRATACANAPGGVQPTFCSDGTVTSTFCQGAITPTICKNGPNQPTICPNGETYTICIDGSASAATACPPPPDGSIQPAHR